MKIFFKKFSPWIVTAIAVIAFSVCLCAVFISCNSGAKLNFKATFYFVCYSTEENYSSAGAISVAVTDYGGAGYILEYDGEYLITVSCYNKDGEAESVKKTLKNRGLECFVKKIEIDGYSLPLSAKPNGKKYLGNINTLYSLSRLAYDCANNLDTGKCGQSQAKSVVSDIKKALKGLAGENISNCFSEEISRLNTICSDAEEGFIYSKDMRKLQIAIADTLINIKLL